MILSDNTTNMVVWNIQKRSGEDKFWTIRFRSATGKEQVDFYSEYDAQAKLEASILEGEDIEKDYRIVKRSTTTRIIEEKV